MHDDRKKAAPLTIAERAEKRRPRMGVRGAREKPERGAGTLTYKGSGVYEGDYVDGKKEGIGRFFDVSGAVYAWMDALTCNHADMCDLHLGLTTYVYPRAFAPPLTTPPPPPRDPVAEMEELCMELRLAGGAAGQNVMTTAERSLRVTINQRQRALGLNPHRRDAFF